jgi:hypothetical protein
MKQFLTLLPMMLMAATIHSQQPSNGVEVLERIQFGANGELIGSADDISSVRKLAQSWLIPPSTVFRALSQDQQVIVVQAAVESLKGAAYLDMVATVLQGVADGNILPRVGSIALASAGSDKEGVLAVNYTDPRIANVLQKVLPRYADNPQQTNFIQKLISGKAKQEHIDWCSAQGLTPAQVVALVPSDAVTDPSQSPKVQPPAPKKAPEAKPSTPSEESTSSTPWSVVAVLIVAAMGLLWLLLKGRK